METFKRNQVEEAIASTLGEREPSADLLGRIKRLLDTDRTLRGPRRSAQQPRAFTSAESPGRGVEHRFSSYEAFALLLGLRMLAMGMSQTQVVTLLRSGRRAIEKAFPRFGVIRTSNVAPKAGDLVISGSYAVGVLFSGYDPATAESAKVIVSDDHKIFQSEALKVAGQSISVFEVGNSAPILARNLERTHPRKRGR